MPASKDDLNYTQRLSSAIDEAFGSYKAGEPEAKTKLYKAFQAQAHNVAIHRLDWNQVAVVERDIVHRAMMALNDFRGQSRVSTWFYRLAVNEVNRALKNHVVDPARLVPLTIIESNSTSPRGAPQKSNLQQMNVQRLCKVHSIESPELIERFGVSDGI